MNKQQKLILTLQRRAKDNPKLKAKIKKIKAKKSHYNWLAQ